jgi:hypothetical protein
MILSSRGFGEHGHNASKSGLRQAHGGVDRSPRFKGSRGHDRDDSRTIAELAFARSCARQGLARRVPHAQEVLDSRHDRALSANARLGGKKHAIPLVRKIAECAMILSPLPRRRSWAPLESMGPSLARQARGRRHAERERSKQPVFGRIPTLRLVGWAQTVRACTISGSRWVPDDEAGMSGDNNPFIQAGAIGQVALPMGFAHRSRTGITAMTGQVSTEIPQAPPHTLLRAHRIIPVSLDHGRRIAHQDGHILFSGPRTAPAARRGLLGIPTECRIIRAGRGGSFPLHPRDRGQQPNRTLLDLQPFRGDVPSPVIRSKRLSTRFMRRQVSRLGWSPIRLSDSRR